LKFNTNSIVLDCKGIKLKIDNLTYNRIVERILDFITKMMVLYIILVDHIYPGSILGYTVRMCYPYCYQL